LARFARRQLGLVAALHVEAFGAKLVSLDGRAIVEHQKVMGSGG
jgi:hypothetical protein